MRAQSGQGTSLDGVLDATVDTVLAFVSVWLVLTVVVTRTTALVGPTVPESTLQLAIALVALGTIYPFVTGLWPLRRFLRFLATAAIIFLALGVVAFVGLLAVGGVATDSTASKLLQFGLVALALLGAGAVSVLGDR